MSFGSILSDVNRLGAEMGFELSRCNDPRRLRQLISMHITKLSTCKLVVDEIIDDIESEERREVELVFRSVKDNALVKPSPTHDVPFGHCGSGADQRKFTSFPFGHWDETGKWYYNPRLVLSEEGQRQHNTRHGYDCSVPGPIVDANWVGIDFGKPSSE